MKKGLLTCVLAAAAMLAACGQKEEPAAATTAPAAEPAATPAPAAAPAVAENPVGKKVYGNVCSMCHSAGVAGAPKPGDEADWSARASQGKEQLYKHAIEGFTGAKGQMPARGGSASLSDDDVKAAVDYMVTFKR
ncbi:c-type cytochrome [Eleftheria terrae]|uniref:c-type cytochrome n=1 Tax=Eleftheria terrae TaxID=1597781 RepID=UPI00263B3367|nr:c-type cytochrome [Eleftheria terrae]WKB55415.1 c-type cytochrome [Eleftheria terrae]